MFLPCLPFRRVLKFTVVPVSRSFRTSVSVRYYPETLAFKGRNVVDVSDVRAPVYLDYVPEAHTTEGKSVRMYDPFALLFLACATPAAKLTVRACADHWGLPHRQAAFVAKLAKDFRRLPGFASAYFQLLSHAEEDPCRQSFSDAALKSLPLP